MNQHKENYAVERKEVNKKHQKRRKTIKLMRESNKFGNMILKVLIDLKKVKKIKW